MIHRTFHRLIFWGSLIVWAASWPAIAAAQGVNVCGVPVDADGNPTDDEGFVTAVAIGTDDINDKQQGFFTDDTAGGGGGADLHILTAGTDLVVDFDPDLDMLDVGDFARPDDEMEPPRPGVLVSLGAIAALSTQITVDGKPALMIDVDGPYGGSTTTLVGMTIDDLGAHNVFFGLDGNSIPPQPATWASAICVTMESGCSFVIPGHEVPGSSGQQPANPPDPCAGLSDRVFDDGFESGGLGAWSSTGP